MSELLMNCVQKYAGKEVDVLWSGGYDSTALIIALLKVGCKVNALSVVSKSLPTTERETVARERIMEIIRDSNNSELGSLFSHRTVAVQSLSERSGDRYRYGQMILWLSTIVIHTVSDDVLIGYIAGDPEVSFIPEMTDIITNVGKLLRRYGRNPIKIDFPIKQAEKVDIVNYLMHQNGALQHVIDFTTYCTGNSTRDMNGLIDPCGKCDSCMRMRMLSHSGNSGQRYQHLNDLDISKLLNLYRPKNTTILIDPTTSGNNWYVHDGSKVAKPIALLVSNGESISPGMHICTMGSYLVDKDGNPAKKLIEYISNTSGIGLYSDTFGEKSSK